MNFSDKIWNFKAIICFQQTTSGNAHRIPGLHPPSPLPQNCSASKDEEDALIVVVEVNLVLQSVKMCPTNKLCGNDIQEGNTRNGYFIYLTVFHSSDILVLQMLKDYRGEKS